jgi:formylmethanofuran dehydrogenase subunit E
MISLYEDPDFQEKMQQEEPYEGLICDECGEPVEYYYYVVDDMVYCEECMESHRHHI